MCKSIFCFAQIAQLLISLCTQDIIIDIFTGKKYLGRYNIMDILFI